MTSDADLSGMTYLDALEYVRHFAITVRKYEQDIARLKDDLALWQKRAGLAAAQGQAELEQAARAKAADISDEIARLGAEQAALRADLALMKPKLAVLKGSPSSGLDADRLAAELELLLAGTGSAIDRAGAATTGKFDELAAEKALAELKKKLSRSG
jgi:capsule polysaccharide export protein KpsE/RkpR